MFHHENGLALRGKRKRFPRFSRAAVTEAQGSWAPQKCSWRHDLRWAAAAHGFFGLKVIDLNPGELPA